MNELIDSVVGVSWKVYLSVLLLHGVAPGFVLRFLLLAYPPDHPRRRELLGELRGVPRHERPIWVASQIELAVCEGLGTRLRSWSIRRRKRRRHEGRWEAWSRRFAFAVLVLMWVATTIQAALAPEPNWLHVTYPTLGLGIGLSAGVAVRRVVEAIWRKP